MEPIRYDIRLDAAKGGSQASITVKRGDSRARLLRMRLVNGGAPVAVQDGVAAVLRGVKPDGTILYNDCVLGGGAFELLLTEQTLAAVGPVECELTVYGADGMVLTTPRFDLYVEDTLYGDGLLESTDEYTGLTDAMTRLTALEAQVGGNEAEREALYDAVREAYESGALQGQPGKDGEPGPQGKPGKDGTSFTLLSKFDTLEALTAAHPTGNMGDAYAVGGKPAEIYIWDAEAERWAGIGSIQGATDNPWTQFTDVQVASAAWASDNTFPDYPFRAAMPLLSVTERMTPMVIFAPGDAGGGNFAPVSATYDGGVYIWAKQAPTDTVSILQILCMHEGEVQDGGEEQPAAATARGRAKELIPSRRRGPMLVFSDDDGRREFLTAWGDIIRDTGVKVCASIITGSVGVAPFMSWDDLRYLQDTLGVEIHSHSHGHVDLTTLTDAELWDDLRASQTALREHGLSSDILAHPLNRHDLRTRAVIRELFRAAMVGNETINTPPLQTYALRRMVLNGGSSPTPDWATLKQQIDDAVSADGLIIYMSHCYYPTFDAASVRQIITYCEQVGMDIVTLSEALDRMGNIIEVGDGTMADGTNYLVVDADGRQYSSAFATAGSGGGTGGGDNWRHINTLNVAQDVTTGYLTIDRDANNSPFVLRKFRVEIHALGAVGMTGGEGVVFANGSATNNGIGIFTRMAEGGSSVQFIECSRSGGWWSATRRYYAGTMTGSSAYQTYATTETSFGRELPNDWARSVHISARFGAGSVITVYGVDA